MRHTSVRLVLSILGTVVVGPAGAELQPIGLAFDVSQQEVFNEALTRVAGSADAGFVVVFRTVGEETGWDIAARRFDAVGDPLGDEFIVHADLHGNQDQPGVAMATDGSFSVVWTEYESFDSPERSIRGRSFDSLGHPLGPDFEITVGDPAPTNDQPDVAVDASGQLVVVWRRFADFTTTVVGRRMSVGGGALGPLFEVSDVALDSPPRPRVARLSSGAFTVVWLEYRFDTGESRVMRRRFDADGVPEESPLELVPGAGPVALALATDGDSFVAWNLSSGDASGQRFDVAGQPKGPLHELEDASGLAVAVDATGRFLMVASVQTITNDIVITGLLVDRSGDAVGAPFAISVAEHDAFRPAAAGIGSHYVVIWEESLGNRLLGQLLGPAAGAFRMAVASSRAGEREREVEVEVLRGGTGGTVSVRYATENGSAAAGEDFVAVTGRLRWTSDDSSPKRIVVPLLDDAAIEDRETFRIVLSDPVGGAGIAEPSSTTVTIVDDDGQPVPYGGEQRVDGGTSDHPDEPAVASAPGGVYLVAWNDFDATGAVEPRVWARASTAAGAPLGPALLLGSGYGPVGAAGSAAGFVVTWQDIEASRGQRLSLAGVLQGSAFTVESEGYSAVGMDASGRVVVTWAESSDVNPGFRLEVYAQRFGADNQPLGPRFLVNTERGGSQLSPDIAVRADGSFAVAWTGDQNFFLTRGYDIYAQSFDSSGARLGSERRVPADPAGHQVGPRIATDESGGMAIAWQSGYGVPGDIYLRRFAADGSPITGDLLVNTFTSYSQFSPDLALHPNGDAVVVWTSGAPSGVGVAESDNPDGSYLGVFGQRFDRDGNRIGAEFQVNERSAGDQRGGRVAVLPGGDFVVAWHSAVRDGEILGVFLRRFTAESECTPNDLWLCLTGGRFRVQTSWTTTAAGSAGDGHAVPLTAETGFFWFFNPANVELVLKVLNGCGVNSGHWVFAGGLTNVETTITVTDTLTGAVRAYDNPQGTPFAPLQDTGAFACP